MVNNRSRIGIELLIETSQHTPSRHVIKIHDEALNKLSLLITLRMIPYTKAPLEFKKYRNVK